MARRGALLAALAVALGIAYAEKRPIEAFFFHAPAGIRSLMEVPNVLGSGYAMTALGGVLVLVAIATKRREHVEAARSFALAGALGFALTRIGCLVLAERRPIEGGAMRLFALGGHGVSGHAVGAGLLLSFAAMRRGWVLAVAVVWALLVAWCRMWLGMHYMWNVLLGLVLGFVSGRAHLRRSS